jgi:hypothetical protein
MFRALFGYISDLEIILPFYSYTRYILFRLGMKHEGKKVEVQYRHESETEGC